MRRPDDERRRFRSKAEEAGARGGRGAVGDEMCIRDSCRDERGDVVRRWGFLGFGVKKLGIGMQGFGFR